VLRLPDVGQGYVIGDDSGCGGLGTENAPPSVAHIAVTYYPVYSCSTEFERLWRARKRTPARGALYVSSTAFVFATDDGVRAGFGAGRDLVAYELGLQSKDLTPRSERPVLGDQASIFFVADAFALGRGGMPGLAVLWRQGRVLGVLYVVGLRESTAKRVALSLARRQTMRIAKPTPVPPRANDDREVALDDPGLRLPVYWLGRRFAPRHGLPRVELYGSSRNVEPEEGFEMAATVSYAGRRGGVTLDLWKPRRWAHFRRSKLGRGFWDSPCARRRTVPLRRGHAELFAGYPPREGKPVQPVPVGKHAARVGAANCPKRRPKGFVAHVYLPRVVVAVDMPACFRGCWDPGSYSSFKGLAAVVRGLRPRGR
jgi:hypothetical protein